MGVVDTIELVCVLCGCCIQNDWVSRAESAPNFVLSLNIPPWKLFKQFRRLQLWATGSFTMTTHLLMHHISRSFLAKHQIPQLAQPSYSPDFVFCDFWLLPKLKSPLKGKRFQTISEIQESMTGQLMATGRTVKSQGACFEGDWGVIIPCTMFPVSCIFFNKCLYFS